MTLVAQILNFLILVVLLRAFCYKPVVNLIKARQDKIQASIDKADSEVAEADKLLNDYKAKLAAANVRAEEIVRNAQKRASEERESQRAAVQREIEQMREAAKIEIQRDRERAMQQLRSDVVNLSIVAAGKILSKDLDKTENEQLVTEFVDKLDKDKIGDLPC